MIIAAKAAIKELEEKRDRLFTPGTEESYMRNRYDLWDQYTKEIATLEEGLRPKKG